MDITLKFPLIQNVKIFSFNLTKFHRSLSHFTERFKDRNFLSWREFSNFLLTSLLQCIHVIDVVHVSSTSSEKVDWIGWCGIVRHSRLLGAPLKFILATPIQAYLTKPETAQPLDRSIIRWSPTTLLSAYPAETKNDTFKFDICMCIIPSPFCFSWAVMQWTCWILYSIIRGTFQKRSFASANYL
jgi:hypothetical protein